MKLVREEIGPVAVFETVMTMKRLPKARQLRLRPGIRDQAPHSVSRRPTVLLSPQKGTTNRATLLSIAKVDTALAQPSLMRLDGGSRHFHAVRAHARESGEPGRPQPTYPSTPPVSPGLLSRIPVWVWVVGAIIVFLMLRR